MRVCLKTSIPAFVLVSAFAAGPTFANGYYEGLDPHATSTEPILSRPPVLVTPTGDEMRSVDRMPTGSIDQRSEALPRFIPGEGRYYSGVDTPVRRPPAADGVPGVDPLATGSIADRSVNRSPYPPYTPGEGQYYRGIVPPK